MTDFDDDEAMAAEYVLGTLDLAERVQAEDRRLREPAFDQRVLDWEDRFAPLAAAAPAVAAPPAVFASLLARLPADQIPPFANDNILLVRRQLRLWRGVAAAAATLAAILALWIVGDSLVPRPAADQTYVAVLQQGQDKPSFVVSLDLASRKMVVMPLATSAPPGKSFELWMIGDHAAPRSMGVVDPHATMRPRLPDVAEGVLSTATYAVTLEPQGGSPTGQPTSAPLFVGKLMNTTL